MLGQIKFGAALNKWGSQVLEVRSSPDPKAEAEFTRWTDVLFGTQKGVERLKNLEGCSCAQLEMGPESKLILFRPTI